MSQRIDGSVMDGTEEELPPLTVEEMGKIPHWEKPREAAVAPVAMRTEVEPSVREAGDALVREASEKLYALTYDARRACQPDALEKLHHVHDDEYDTWYHLIDERFGDDDEGGAAIAAYLKLLHPRTMLVLNGLLAAMQMNGDSNLAHIRARYAADMLMQGGVKKVGRGCGCT